MLTGDCDIEVDGVGDSQSKIRFVYNTKESQESISPSQPAFEPPQIQVMHSLPHNPEGFQDILATTPTVIPENPNKIFETPAVKSRHIDPNSSPRRSPEPSPSKVGDRIQYTLAGLMANCTPSDDELDLTASESESEPFVPTAPLSMDIDTIDSTPGFGIANPPTAPGTEEDNGRTSESPVDDVQSSAENMDLDEGSGAPPDSLPPLFRAEEERKKLEKGKRLKQPARLYGKKGANGKPLTVIEETPAANPNGSVEREDSATPVPVPASKKEAAKKRKIRPSHDEVAPGAAERAAKKKRKGKAGTRVASVEEEEELAPKPNKGKQPIGRAPKTPKAKSRESISSMQVSGNAYILSEAQGDQSEEDDSTAVTKTPKSRVKTTTKKTPLKKTPLAVRKKPIGPSATPAEDVRPQTSTLRTTDHHEGSPPRVSFSNSTLADDKQILKFLRTHGGKVTPSSADSTCNYLVVGPGELKRTPKFIIAVVRGIRIVEDQWVRDSNKAGYWVDSDPYLPNDSEREKEWGCSLATALERGRNGECQVLAGKTVYLTPSLLSHLKAVGMEDGLLGMLKAAGAEHIHKKAPRGEVENDTLVLGKDDGEKDLATLEKGGWKVFGTGVIGMSVMRGVLETGDEFVVKPGSSAGEGTQKKKRGGRKSVG